MQKTETQVRLDLDNSWMGWVPLVVKGFRFCHIRGEGGADHGAIMLVESTTKSRVLAAWTMSSTQQTARSGL